MISEGFVTEVLKQDSFGKPHKAKTTSRLLTLTRNTMRATPPTRRGFT